MPICCLLATSRERSSRSSRRDVPTGRPPFPGGRGAAGGWGCRPEAVATAAADAAVVFEGVGVCGCGGEGAARVALVAVAVAVAVAPDEEPRAAA